VNEQSWVCFTCGNEQSWVGLGVGTQQGPSRKAMISLVHLGGGARSRWLAELGPRVRESLVSLGDRAGFALWTDLRPPG